MPGYVVHAAVFDDVRRLALQHEALPAAFHQSLRDHPDYGRAGSYTRGDDVYVVPLLTKYRYMWTGDDEATAQQLAWVLGWLAHRAAHRIMDPAHRLVEAEHVGPGQDAAAVPAAALWSDLVLYDAAYDRGRTGVVPEDLFSRHLQDYEAGQALDVRHLEDVVHAQWLAGLAALRLRVADEGASFADRVDTFLAERPVYRAPLGGYADRMEQPDPIEQQRFLRTAPLYDADDLLIVMAHGPEQRRAGIDLDEARAQAQVAGSPYAHVLSDALDVLDHAAAYWRREIHAGQLKERLDLTTPTHGPANTARVHDILTDSRTAIPTEAP